MMTETHSKYPLRMQIVNQNLHLDNRKKRPQFHVSHFDEDKKYSSHVFKCIYFAFIVTAIFLHRVKCSTSSSNKWLRLNPFLTKPPTLIRIVLVQITIVCVNHCSKWILDESPGLPS